MARKSIGNSSEDVICEYLSMLEKGFASIKDQMEMMGGDKWIYVKSTSKVRAANFEGGSFLDAIREIYNVSDEDLMPLVGKFLDYVHANKFEYTLTKELFDKFLEENIDELNAQAERYK